MQSIIEAHIERSKARCAPRMLENQISPSHAALHVIILLFATKWPTTMKEHMIALRSAASNLSSDCFAAPQENLSIAGVEINSFLHHTPYSQQIKCRIALPKSFSYSVSMMKEKHTQKQREQSNCSSVINTSDCQRNARTDVQEQYLPACGSGQSPAPAVTHPPPQMA